VRLASRGQRDLDQGAQAIDDSAELAQVKSQARKVHMQSLVAAALLTALALAVPRP
jgi:hypothetical protein